jgi:hypothetical protein
MYPGAKERTARARAESFITESIGGVLFERKDGKGKECDERSVGRERG